MVRSKPAEGLAGIWSREELAVAAAELRTAFDRVVAKGVMLPQELLDRSFRDCLPGTATLSDDHLPSRSPRIR